MPGLTNRARSAAMEIHKTIISAIEKTAQAWAEEHEETETLEINIPGSNVNVFSEIIERHMRDPGTSIIHWKRYGDEKPNQSRRYIRATKHILQDGHAASWVPRGEIPPNCWLDDDLWAYLPCPPEAAQ